MRDRHQASCSLTKEPPLKDVETRVRTPWCGFVVMTQALDACVFAEATR